MTDIEHPAVTEEDLDRLTVAEWAGLTRVGAGFVRLDPLSGGAGTQIEALIVRTYVGLRDALADHDRYPGGAGAARNTLMRLASLGVRGQRPAPSVYRVRADFVEDTVATLALIARRCEQPFAALEAWEFGGLNRARLWRGLAEGVPAPWAAAAQAALDMHPENPDATVLAAS